MPSFFQAIQINFHIPYAEKKIYFIRKPANNNGLFSIFCPSGIFLYSRYTLLREDSLILIHYNALHSPHFPHVSLPLSVHICYHIRLSLPGTRRRHLPDKRNASRQTFRFFQTLPAGKSLHLHMPQNLSGMLIILHPLIFPICECPSNAL